MRTVRGDQGKEQEEREVREQKAVIQVRQKMS